MSTGLGDTVKKITEFFNIEQCEGYKERQAALNRLFPYVVRPTSDEIVFLYEVFSWYKGLPIPAEKAEDIKKCEALFRKPGQNKFATQRKEGDVVEILSGVFEGITTGTSISMIIFNENQKSSDYSNVKDLFRPGHADFTYFNKYGIRDYRGDLS